MRKETIGNATLYLADCRDVLPVLKGFDVIVTDPPYVMDAGGTGDWGRGHVKQIKAKGLDSGFDVKLLNSAERWLCFCAKAQIVDLIQQAESQRLCWMLRTWNKTNPVPLVNRTYLPDTEYMVHAFKQHDYEGKNRYLLGAIVKSTYDHPTVKPQYVMQDALNCSTHINDVVLDPFMGSGSTGVACMEMGRKFIGVELNPDYYAIARDRLRRAQQQMRLKL